MLNTFSYRMAQMQIMNIVNIGFSKGVSPTDIEILATATIDATQLFLEPNQIKSLRLQLKNRLDKQKIMI